MIRSKLKIFGEANDPNTVLATGTLTNDQLVVGAGNKGIKSFIPGARKLLYTNASGELKAFDYSTPNKLIGTNSTGDLILKDLPTPNSLICPDITSITFSEGYTVNNLNRLSDVSYTANVSSSTSTKKDAKLYINFTPFEIDAIKPIKLLISIIPISNEVASPVTLSGTMDISSDYNTNIVNVPSLLVGGSVIAGVLHGNLPSGNYACLRVSGFKMATGISNITLKVLLGYILG